MTITTRRNLARTSLALLVATAATTCGALATTGVLDARAAGETRVAVTNARAWAGTTNLARLPLGDGKVSTTRARRGWVYSCSSPMGAPGGGYDVTRPWIHGSTWSYLEKAKVTGGRNWSSRLKVRRSGSQRILTGNGLPNHRTGTFPIQLGTTAAQYDRNPNAISSTTIDLALPASPRFGSSPSCLPFGPIGVMLSGATIFNALDADGKDAPAREIQDGCSGHPQQQGTYHYHALPACIYSGPANKPSKIIGYALDGFPITGPRGAGGRTYTNAMLDACHGTYGPVTVGKTTRRMYHYVATMEYPYTLGCFRGTSALAGRR